MIFIKSLNTNIISNSLMKSTFIIEPLNSGEGLTIGNALRRTLLTNISGTCITGIKGNLNPISIDTNTRLLEDFFEVSLNLKNIILYSPIVKKTKALISVTGPCIITAAQIKLPNNIILCNPKQYIATLLNGKLDLELLIEQGKGYKLADESLGLNITGYHAIDAKFSPVVKVNFKIKIKTFKDNEVRKLKESLILEIWTNKSVTPKRALLESIKIILTNFSKLLF
jgi:DNA-directed RNA polymerase subunit alpha